MAGKSSYLEAKLIDHTTGKTAYTMPTVYVAAYTGAPTDAGGGTEVSATGTAYARAATTGATWNAATGNPASATNASTISFAQASASWGTVTHVGLMDASSGGNLLRWAALTTSKTIGTGDTLTFPAGSISITED